LAGLPLTSQYPKPLLFQQSPLLKSASPGKLKAEERHDGMRIDSAAEMLEQRLNRSPAPNAAPILENHPTRSATTIDGWRSVLFGMPFVAGGVFIGVLALGVVPGSKEVPGWVMGVFGALFFFSGLFFVIHGLLGAARKSRYLSDVAQRPNQPWLCDFHWSQEGIAFSAFNAMLGRLLAALVWTAFPTLFVWVGLNLRGARVFLYFSLFPALCSLIFWYRWAQMLADLIRYGNSFLRYDSFPYFLGGTLGARLRAPHHVLDIDALTATLRCVQEQYVTSGSGSHRSTRVVCYELYKDSTTLTRERLAGYAGGEIPVEFRLPVGQPATSLASTPPVYWEIEFRGKSVKVSYEAYFLVPVYKAS